MYNITYKFYFVHATITPAETQVCASEAPAMREMEEWEGTVTLVQCAVHEMS